MLPTWYSEYKNFIDESIEQYLDSYFLRLNNSIDDGFKEAVYYSLKGGKRVRSVLALEFYFTFTNKTLTDLSINDDIVNYCIAIELLHAYSLVHDDLPCMDNDELRRGKLTVWKKYGEYQAILVGDLLNSMSFEIMSDFSDEVDIKILLSYFGKSVGYHGMIGGQILDMYYESNQDKLNLEKLIEVHNKKTGALIEASIVGAILITNKDVDIIPYIDFGKKLGLAFQVKDDLLDVEGTREQTGKSVGGEQKGFVYFIGLEKTKVYLEELINECKNTIKSLESEKLGFLVDYVGNRKK